MLDAKTYPPSFIYGCFPSYVSLYVANILIRKYGLKPEALLISTRPMYIKGKKVTGMSGINFLLK